MSSPEDLYDAYDIDDAYDTPASYGADDSAYGNGRYPPDWQERKAAVVDRQDGQCGRCGRSDDGDGVRFEPHHYVPLGEGGGNELENLVALCLDCHSAVHPGVEETNGDWRDAPRYPTADADPRVSFVVKPAPSEAVTERILLELLAQTSTPGENVHAQSAVTVGLAPKDARKANGNLEAMLRNRGYPIAEITDHVTDDARYDELLGPRDLPEGWTCARCGEETPYHRFVSFRLLTYDTDKRLPLCWKCGRWAVEHSDRRRADVLDELEFTVPVTTETFLRG
jgi:hypothetical protein